MIYFLSSCTDPKKKNSNVKKKKKLFVFFFPPANGVCRLLLWICYLKTLTPLQHTKGVGVIIIFFESYL